MWEPNQFKELTAREATRTWTILLFSIFFVLLIYTMPWLMDSFAPTGDTLDVSWAWMLGYGLQHHLQWGKSILFTYGPFGFLANPFFYSDHLLWGIAALVQSTIWIIFGLGFVWILSCSLPETKTFSRFVLPVAVAWLIGASLVDLATRSTFIGILLLIFAIDGKRKKISVVFLLTAGICLAFGSLIKSTSLIMAFLLVCIYPLLWWYVHARKQNIILSLLPFLAFAVSLIALWVLAGQDITNLPAYFQGTWAIASGYTPAMSIHGKSLQTVVALIILVLFIITIFMVLLKKERVLLAQGLILGVPVFWAWKEGFTRHDPGFSGGHAMAFFGVALLVAAAGLVLLSGRSQRIAIVNVAGIYLLALVFALPGANFDFTNEIANYKIFVSLITSKAHRETQQHEETSAIANQFHLDPALLDAVKNHSVNIIPWNLMMAQGYHMDLVASPIFQAYSVYTPYLDHLNAQQIWKGKSADKVIYTFESIDGRYPIFDEPATFRALLTCYRTEYASDPYTVLSRSQCVKPKLTKVGEPIKSGFNTWVVVPAHASYVDLAVRTTLVGHLMNILYKPDQVHILFKLSDGSIKGPYRFIYPVGSDGLFVKYFINSQNEANRLFAGDASGLQKIDAFRLVTTSKSIDYGNGITSQFLSVTPPHPFKIRWVEVKTPVEPLDNTPLALTEGQKLTMGFVIHNKQMSSSKQISSIGIFQGNYNNTATGALSIKICNEAQCVLGSRPLSQSQDNSFFNIHLQHPLTVGPGDELSLTISHLSGKKPDALWLWPEAPGYPQSLLGPNGPIPGKAVRIRLKYHLQGSK
jgi:hypothetical protein